MNKVRKYLFWFLILVYVSGTIGMPLNKSFFLPFTPLNLLLTVTVFLLYAPSDKMSYFISFFSIALLGYVLEVIGVATGLVFGDYHYGNALGPALLDVPLLISVNWALLIACAVPLAGKLSGNRWWISVISAVLVTTLDLIMEQVAPSLDFWYFTGGIAGIHNYVGWLLISFVGAFTFNGTLLKGNLQISVTLLILQLIFFSVIALVAV